MLSSGAVHMPNPIKDRTAATDKNLSDLRQSSLLSIISLMIYYCPETSERIPINYQSICTAMLPSHISITAWRYVVKAIYLSRSPSQAFTNPNRDGFHHSCSCCFPCLLRHGDGHHQRTVYLRSSRSSGSIDGGRRQQSLCLPRYHH